MLQQTRVETVIPYYERFLVRWPTVDALASADPEDVRAAWSGLGYYRRAKLMLDAARLISEQHGGQLPGDLDALAALPGFGRYTAGAVASIGFDIAAPAVDGNVGRVLARLEGIEGDIMRGEPQRRVWALAAELAPGESPREHTQALIELGALVCASQKPKCLLCPVAKACVAHAEGTVDRIPTPRKKPTRKTLERTAWIWSRNGRVLLARQPDDGLFAGLWTPPLWEGHLEPDESLEKARAHGWTVEAAEEVDRIKHVLTHRDLEIRVVRLKGVPPSRPRAPFRLVDLRKLDDLGVPSLTVKALRVGLVPKELSGLTLPGRRTSRRP